jgi:hypothetical protein
MAEKPDKNKLLLEKQAKEEARQAKVKEKYEFQQLGAIQALGKKQDRWGKVSEFRNRIEEAQVKAQELERIGRTEEAERFIKAIDDLNSGVRDNSNNAVINNRMLELELLDQELSKYDQVAQEAKEERQRQHEEALAKHEQRERVKEKLKERFERQNVKTLKELSKDIKQGTELAENDVALIEKQLNAMDRFYLGDKSNSDAIRAELVKAQELINSGDEDQKKVGLEMLKEAKSAGEDEEKRREAAEQAELQNMALTRIGDGISGLGEKLGDFGKSAVKTGGLLAGLAGLVLGVIDPEKLVEIITNLTEGFLEIVEGIVLFFEGDFEGAKAKIGENIVLFGGLILGLALYFGGPLITAFGGIFTKLAKVVRAIKVFRTFMIGLFSPTMLSTMSTMLTALGGVLAPLLPIIAVIAVIAAAFMILKSQLGEGASIMDTLKLGALYLIDGLSMLVNGITFLPRKIFEFLGGGRLARWLFGDEVGDMVDQFLGEGLDTNRAGKFKEETKARLAQEKRDKELKEQAEEEGVIIDGVDITDPTSADNLAAAQNENAQGNLDIATAGQDGITASVNNVQSTSSSTRNTVIQYSVPNSSASILSMLAR